MKPLRDVLDREIERVNRSIDYKDLDIKHLITVMNESPYMLKMNGLARKDFKLICSDLTRDFYGYEDNDLSSMNMRFYYEVVHPNMIINLVKNIMFFSRNDVGYLEIDYTLKNNKKEYVKVYGVSKTVAWDERGKPLFALSLMCLKEDYVVQCAIEYFKLNDITLREREVLTNLVNGLSNSQISYDLSVSEKTVEKYVSSIYSKAGISGRAAFYKIINTFI